MKNGKLSRYIEHMYRANTMSFFIIIFCQVFKKRQIKSLRFDLENIGGFSLAIVKSILLYTEDLS